MKILDVLFPKRCPYCDNLMQYDNLYCCDNCKSFFSIHMYSHNLNNSQCVSPFLYKDEYKRAILNYKFYNKAYFAKPFSNALLKTIDISYKDIRFDVVTCVPLSKESIRERQYNQSELLARFISKRKNTPYSSLLVKIKSNSPQHTLLRNEREQNVVGVYSAKDSKNIYKNILLIDDIITTGSTLNECVKVLKQKYNCNIYCATLALA